MLRTTFILRYWKFVWISLIQISDYQFCSINLKLAIASTFWIYFLTITHISSIVWSDLYGRSLQTGWENKKILEWCKWKLMMKLKENNHINFYWRLKNSKYTCGIKNTQKKLLKVYVKNQFDIFGCIAALFLWWLVCKFWLKNLR